MEEDTFLDKLIIGIFGALAFLFVSILLMIPIANVFIASRIFSERKEK